MVEQMNREDWLGNLAFALEGLFEERGAKLPAYRVTCGFPSSGGLSKLRTLGQCWSDQASADDTHELIVSMTIDDPMRVADILAHEMIHAAVGVEHGHKGPFRKLALAIGLAGPMTATVAGEAFKQRVSPWLDELGDYPHAKIDASTRKKQGTRLIKTECPHCGYTARVTRKWLAVGAPICPVDQVELEEPAE